MTEIEETSEEPSGDERLRELFELARDLPRDRIEEFIRERCADDPPLAEELAELLEMNMWTVDSPVEATTRGSISALSAGDMVDEFSIIRLLGEGGFGEVYLAEESGALRRQVALKIIKLGMDTKSVIARFDAEQRALGQLNHDYIAKVHTAGVTGDGRAYFVMEYIEGSRSLTTYCDDFKLSVRERLHLFMRVCEGIQHAHDRGIIHRDIKPGNILVTEDADGEAQPKVIDFGIAKAAGLEHTEHSLSLSLSVEGQMLGTPVYMSPEQSGMIDSGQIDVRTDVYSLGVVLYELTSGTLPFPKEMFLSKGINEIQRIIQEEIPPEPSSRLSDVHHSEGHTGLRIAERRSTRVDELVKRIRNDINWITSKALQKKREDRYANPSALREDVRRHLDNQPVHAAPESRLYRWRKAARRHRNAALSVIVLFSVVVAVSVVLIRNSDTSGENAALSETNRELTAENEELEAKNRTLEKENERLERITLENEYRERLASIDLLLDQKSMTEARALWEDLEGFADSTAVKDVASDIGRLRAFEAMYLASRVHTTLRRYPTRIPRGETDDEDLLDRVGRIHLSPDGRFLVTVSPPLGFLKQVVRICDLFDRDRVDLEIPSPEASSLLSIDFGPPGSKKPILYWSTGRQEVDLAEFEAGRVRGYPAGGEASCTAGWSGRRFTAFQDWRYREKGAEAPFKLRHLAKPAEVIAVGMNGQRPMLAATDGITVSLYRPALPEGDKREIRLTSKTSRSDFNRLEFSPDGRYLAAWSHSDVRGRGDAVGHLWDLKDTDEDDHPREIMQGFVSVDFRPGADEIYMRMNALGPNTFEYEQDPGGAWVAVTSGSPPVFDYAPDAHRAVWITQEGEVTCMRMSPRFDLRTVTFDTRGIAELKLSPDGRFFVDRTRKADVDHVRAHVFPADATFMTVGQPPDPGKTIIHAVDSLGSCLAIMDGKERLRLFDLRTRKPLRDHRIDQNGGPVRSLEFRDKGRKLFIRQSDLRTELDWCDLTRRTLTIPSEQASDQPILRNQLQDQNRNEDRLARSRGNQIHIFDAGTDTSKPLLTIDEHEEEVIHLRFIDTPEGDAVLSIHRDGRILIHDARGESMALWERGIRDGRSYYREQYEFCMNGEDLEDDIIARMLGARRGQYLKGEDQRSEEEAP